MIELDVSDDRCLPRPAVGERIEIRARHHGPPEAVAVGSNIGMLNHLALGQQPAHQPRDAAAKCRIISHIAPPRAQRMH